MEIPSRPVLFTASAAACHVRVTNLQFLNALLYVAEHGCKWRGLPKRFGPWHTIYTRMNRWSKNGALEVVFEAAAPSNWCGFASRPSNLIRPR